MPGKCFKQYSVNSCNIFATGLYLPHILRAVQATSTKHGIRRQIGRITRAMPLKKDQQVNTRSTSMLYHRHASGASTFPAVVTPGAEDDTAETAVVDTAVADTAGTVAVAATVAALKA